MPGEELSINPMQLLNSGPPSMECDGFQSVITTSAATLQDESFTPRFGSLITKSESPLRISLDLNVSSDPIPGAPPEEAVLCRAGKELLLGDLVPRKGRRRKRYEDEDQVDDEALPMQTPRSMNPQDYYGAPQRKPEPWGWVRADTGECMFTYNELGEFEYGKVFSRTELDAYLYAQPPQRSSSSKHAQNAWVERQILPGEKRVRGKCRHGLTLWIGWAPAQLNDRFPSPESHKCRFKGCPARDGKFRGGQPRVTFDERMNVDGSRDPYHVAGYMHLFCLEQQFDILKLIADLDLRLDTRYFFREEAGNPASFHSRQNSRQQIKAAHSWLAKEWQRFVAWDKHISRLRAESKMSGRRLTRDQTARPRHFDDSLTKNMVETDVENYSAAGKECRKARSKEAREQGKTIIDAGTHLGNLEFIREQLDIRSNRTRSVKFSRKKSVCPDDPALGHRVYDLAHFIEGFQAGRRGPSGLDALGWLQEQPQAPLYVQNEILPLSHDCYSQPTFLLSPTFEHNSGMLSGMPLMNNQAQLSYPNLILPEISAVAPFSSMDHVSGTFNWTAQAGPPAAVPCGGQPILADANQVVATAATSTIPIAKRQGLDDFQLAFPLPEGPAFEVSHVADRSNLANALEYIPCEAESRPVVCVNRGESPIDGQLSAKTNKRSHDETSKHPQYGESIYTSALYAATIGDGPPPCKKARIDPSMLDEVIKGRNHEGRAGEAFDGGMADLIGADEHFDFSFRGAVPNGAPSAINGDLPGKFANTTSQCFEPLIHSTGTASRDGNTQPLSLYGDISTKNQKPSGVRASDPIRNLDVNFDEFLYGDWDSSEDFNSLFLGTCQPSVSSLLQGPTGFAMEELLPYNVESHPLPDHNSLEYTPLLDVGFPFSTPGEPARIAAQDYECANVQ